MPAGFCRDCFKTYDLPVPSRCTRCCSPRTLCHSELDRLFVAHVDCDAFYAAVEKRDDPSLRDRAVIIGGGRRGVVLTACYNARIHGVRSAMPMYQALKLCPHAVVVRPDMTKYAAVGRAIRASMAELTPLVQPVSIDEAFLDLSGTQTLHGDVPAIVLARFAERIERDLGVTVSVGLSDCKFLAKLASDVDKPRGFTIIGRAEAIAFLRSMPVSAIAGVGAVMRRRLEERGFRTIGDIQACTPAEFARHVGDGAYLWRLARGLDDRPVRSERAAKSLSAETTFGADLAEADELIPILYRLCEKVASRLSAQEVAAAGVVLKLKTRDFKIRTRSLATTQPTQLAARLFQAGRSLLLPELDGTRFRLIGIAASDLQPQMDADQGDLLDASLPRQKAAARAIDTVRARFGGEALVRGITLGRSGRQ